MTDGPESSPSRDIFMLEFEQHWAKHTGAKEAAIRDTFQMSPARYYQALNTLIDDPAALAADPTLVNRLRRLREVRIDRRAARQFGPGSR